MAAALVMSIFLPLFGFAYVRGMVAFDRQTGTMEILLAGGVGRFRYVFGKFLSGFVLLFTLLLIVMAGSWLTVMVRFPGEQISVWRFVSPYLALVPGLLFVSALSLLLETAAIFRSGRLNAIVMILYVIFFIVNMTVALNITQRDISSIGITWDFTGMGLLILAVEHTAIATTGNPIGSFIILGSSSGVGGTNELFFTGLAQNVNTAMSMGITACAALALAVFAALALEKRPVTIRQKGQQAIQPTTVAANTASAWQPVPAGEYSFVSMLRVELRRIAGNLGIWWLAVTGALWIASWVAEASTTREMLLPLLYGASIFPFSNLGCEERLTGVDDYLRTIPGAPLRQSLSSCSAALVISFILALPALVGALSSGLWAALVILGWALCLPTLGFMLGAFTKTRRTYQILVLVFLYVVLNMPTILLPTVGSRAVIMTIVYFSIAVVSFGAVFAQKKTSMA